MLGSGKHILESDQKSYQYPSTVTYKTIFKRYWDVRKCF